LGLFLSLEVSRGHNRSENKPDEKDKEIRRVHEASKDGILKV